MAGVAKYVQIGRHRQRGAQPVGDERVPAGPWLNVDHAQPPPPAPARERDLGKEVDERAEVERVEPDDAHAGRDGGGERRQRDPISVHRGHGHQTPLAVLALRGEHDADRGAHGGSLHRHQVGKTVVARAVLLEDGDGVAELVVGDARLNRHNPHNVVVFRRGEGEHGGLVGHVLRLPHVDLDAETGPRLRHDGVLIADAEVHDVHEGFRVVARFGRQPGLDDLAEHRAIAERLVGPEDLRTKPEDVLGAEHQRLARFFARFVVLGQVGDVVSGDAAKRLPEGLAHNHAVRHLLAGDLGERAALIVCGLVRAEAGHYAREHRPGFRCLPLNHLRPDRCLRELEAVDERPLAKGVDPFHQDLDPAERVPPEAFQVEVGEDGQHAPRQVLLDVIVVGVPKRVQQELGGENLALLLVRLVRCLDVAEKLDPQALAERIGVSRGAAVVDQALVAEDANDHIEDAVRQLHAELTRGDLVARTLSARAHDLTVLGDRQRVHLHGCRLEMGPLLLVGRARRLVVVHEILEQRCAARLVQIKLLTEQESVHAQATLGVRRADSSLFVAVHVSSARTDAAHQVVGVPIDPRLGGPHREHERPILWPPSQVVDLVVDRPARDRGQDHGHGTVGRFAHLRARGGEQVDRERKCLRLLRARPKARAQVSVGLHPVTPLLSLNPPGRRSLDCAPLLDHVELPTEHPGERQWQHAREKLAVVQLHQLALAVEPQRNYGGTQLILRHDVVARVVVVQEVEKTLRVVLDLGRGDGRVERLLAVLETELYMRGACVVVEVVLRTLLHGPLHGRPLVARRTRRGDDEDVLEHRPRLGPFRPVAADVEKIVGVIVEHLDEVQGIFQPIDDRLALHLVSLGVAEGVAADDVLLEVRHGAFGRIVHLDGVLFTRRSADMRRPGATRDCSGGQGEHEGGKRRRGGSSGRSISANTSLCRTITGRTRGISSATRAGHRRRQQRVGRRRDVPSAVESRG
mmetsp:Transcript_15859/g.61822  ORF Transcript_15859/g.61822 Transcript_15859/m.61822 type:complete len:975 (-) Transcript_15859:692-3616(-)